MISHFINFYGECSSVSRITRQIIPHKIPINFITNSCCCFSCVYACFKQKSFCVIKTGPIWDRNFKLIWLVRVQKGLYQYFIFLNIKILSLQVYIPHYIPQPHFWEKKNPNLLVYKELGFLNVVPPVLEPLNYIVDNQHIIN